MRQMLVILSEVESRRTVSKFTKRKGKPLLYVFTSSVKREIKKFRQKNVQKNVMQEQKVVVLSIYSIAWFCPSLCRRRRHCLSSL